MEKKHLVKGLLVVVALVCPAFCWADGDLITMSESSQSLYYNITSTTEKTCEVTGLSTTSSNQYTYKGDIVIPDSATIRGETYTVTGIGKNAFTYCYDLTSVTIPKTVTYIGENAFYQCTSLEGELIIPDGVEKIYFGAFDYCRKLTSVSFGCSVDSIGGRSFANCTKITAIKSFNPTPPIISDSSFEDGIVDLEVAKDGLINYAKADFWSDFPIIYANEGEDTYYPALILYSGQTLVTANNGDENGVIAKEGETIMVTPIGSGNISSGIVEYCGKNITEELNTNGKYTFSMSNVHKANRIYSYDIDTSNTYDITLTGPGQLLEQITVANINSVYRLKIKGDINGTDVLTIRKMPNIQLLDLSAANVVRGGDNYYNDSYSTSNNTIGEYFFAGLSSLCDIQLPKSVTSIKQNAFQGCTGLVSLAIPENVDSLSFGGYMYSVAIENLTIEDSPKSLYMASTSSNFRSLNVAYLGRTLSYYTTFFRENTSLVSLTIGDYVTNIANYAFYGCSGLVSRLSLHNNITSIGDYAFYGCSGLSGDLVFPNNITSIGEYSFYGCSGLSGDLVFPNNITSIGASTFCSCSGFTKLYLGKDCLSIDKAAFSGCSALKEIYSQNPTPPSITSSTFGNVDKESCILYVPNGSLNTYWLNTYWGEFLDIREMDMSGIGLPAIDGVNINGYYTIDGKAISNPQKGINIVRYSDGTAKKMLVK